MTPASLGERRTQRTSESREAARRLLASLAARHAMHAVALATDGGGLITCIGGEAHDPRWLAALACLGPLAHHHVRPDVARVLHVIAIAIGPYTLHVAALCEGPFPADEIEAGVRRVYEPACYAA